VPKLDADRKKILDLVEKYFKINKILPPVSYNKLLNIAGDILKANDINEKFHAFAMLCCGNAIWRNVFGTIPYNRRLLLLPECLKNSQNCKADRDSFGVLCSACGACSISDILTKADQLGYVSLITEGTTITQKLIEQGNIEAVVGVGCINILQKMYKTVNKYAIPSIGIPLLYNGCKDTAVDQDWLFREIHHKVDHHKFRPLNLNHLHDKTKTLFKSHILAEILGKPENETETIAQAYLQLGGQRLRPLFTLMMYQAFSKIEFDETSKRLAFAVECFHKASLIHDDIEDNDTERYGQKAIHVKYGIPIAINIGDYLIGLGYKLISDCQLDPNSIANCIRVASEAHVTLTTGQGFELCTIWEQTILTSQEMIKIFQKKTSAAFRVALLLGLSAANANAETVQIFHKLSDYIGIAYQIKDDLKDYRINKGDALTGNVVLSILFDDLLDTEKDWASNALEINDTNLLFDQIEKRNIIDIAEGLMQFYLDQAFLCLEDINNLTAKLALHEAIGKIFDKYL
jgi:geranylgeranyl pyrophosphate synthase